MEDNKRTQSESEKPFSEIFYGKKELTDRNFSFLEKYEFQKLTEKFLKNKFPIFLKKEHVKQSFRNGFAIGVFQAGTYFGNLKKRGKAYSAPFESLFREGDFNSLEEPASEEGILLQHYSNLHIEQARLPFVLGKKKLVDALLGGFLTGIYLSGQIFPEGGRAENK